MKKSEVPKQNKLICNYDLNLEDSINNLLNETENNIMKLLMSQEVFSFKQKEYLKLKNELIPTCPELKRLLKIKSELTETERNVAQIVGMTTMVQLHQLLEFKDNEKLLKFLNVTLDNII